MAEGPAVFLPILTQTLKKARGLKPRSLLVSQDPIVAPPAKSTRWNARRAYRIVFVAFTNCVSSAALLPVFRLRSKREKLLDDTSSRIRCPFKKTLLVDHRSILYS